LQEYRIVRGTEAGTMQWDLGWQGIGVLAGLSLGFGILAQLLFWARSTRWVWIIGSVAFFAVGLLISEVWFGWATAEDLQPNIDGLSFDEVLIGFAVGIPVLLVARYLVRNRMHPPVP
jgi:Na+/proline symporter